ncbi:MAG: hypothetical protein E7032_05210 [Akkermansiaceae bacterium]|nr:hypothetical protein [Akkermansiaceae bacterium]
MKRILLQWQWFAIGLLCLSACCEIPTDGVVSLPSAPGEVLSAMEQEHSACIKRTQTDFPKALRGGPGFTRETAWKILIKDRAAVSFEYLVLGRLNLGEPYMQSLVEHDGRYYDMHLIETEHGGERYQVEQWFDITPYFKAL